MSFFEVFQPTARHQREERDRQNTLVTRPAAGAGGPLGIDLESGKATIAMPQRPEPEEQTELEAQTDSREQTELDTAAKSEARSELEAQAEKKESDAADEVPVEDRPGRHPDLDG